MVLAGGKRRRRRRRGEVTSAAEERASVRPERVPCAEAESRARAGELGAEQQWRAQESEKSRRKKTYAGRRIPRRGRGVGSGCGGVAWCGPVWPSPQEVQPANRRKRS